MMKKKVVINASPDLKQAAKRNKKAITMTEIDEATIKVEVGAEKKSHKITEKSHNSLIRAYNSIKKT